MSSLLLQDDPHLAHVVLFMPGYGPNRYDPIRNKLFTEVSMGVSEGLSTASGQAPYPAAPLFNGSNSRIYRSSDSAFWLGSGDWTFEYTARITGQPRTNPCIIAHRGSWSSNNGFVLEHRTNIIVFYGGNTGSAGTFSASTDNPIGTFARVAVQRAGSSIAFFKDGVLINESPISSTFPNVSANINIGCFDNTPWPNSFFQGNIQDLRVTIGAARYAGSYTPVHSLWDGTFRQLSGALAAPVTIGNNATKIGGGAVDQVLIFEGNLSRVLAVIEPDINGDWSADVPSGTYYLGYLAEGCEPVFHGPYVVAA